MKITDLERSIAQSKIYLDGLTGLRGIAALWVLVFHAFLASEHKEHIVVYAFGQEWSLTIFVTGGWVGVDIFFVLSGFLLSIPFIQVLYHDGKPVNLKTYTKRRLLRVLPAYYFQLAVLSVIAIYLGIGKVPGWDNIFAHIFMIHNLEYKFNGAINAVYWTLPIEFGFYVLLPFIFWIISKRGLWVTLSGCLILVLVYRWGVFQFIQDAPVPRKVWLLGQLPGRLDQFAMGIVAAYLFLRLEPYWERKNTQYLSALLMAIGIIGLFQCLFYFGGGQARAHYQGHISLFTWHIIVGFFIGQFVLGIALTRNWMSMIFGNSILIYLGLISYSIYLWHLPIVRFVNKMDFIQNMETPELPYIASISFFITIIVSSILYWLVERPFLKIRSRKKDKV